jgi:hypothetical protein
MKTRFLIIFTISIIGLLSLYGEENNAFGFCVLEKLPPGETKCRSINMDSIIIHGNTTRSSTELELIDPQPFDISKALADARQKQTNGTGNPNASFLSAYTKEFEPPLKQIQMGIPIQDIQCNDGKFLIHKRITLSPACVSDHAANTLIFPDYGWALLRIGPPAETITQELLCTSYPDVKLVQDSCIVYGQEILSSPQVTKDLSNIWKPQSGDTWNWQLEGPTDTSFDVDVYDLDLYDTSKKTINKIHDKGGKVICYISVGTYEMWRSDIDDFPPEILGNDYEGWPGEKWLDIRNFEALIPIIENRFDMCAEKGFDGIEPDNIDGYESDTGFDLTYDDQINFNKKLAEMAHVRGLSIGLKNDFGQVEDLEPFFDWALTEDCDHYDECETLLPFIDSEKAVFQAEYTDLSPLLDEFCKEYKGKGFSPILKNRELDAPFEACQ